MITIYTHSDNRKSLI